MAEKATVLFVGDEKHILFSLRALFRTQYQVFLAESGASALDILQRETIHVIVSDQRMPKMLGHELLREAKKLSPSTMRLLLTGYSDLGAIMHSINDGEVFRFINKPWDNAELRAILDNAVKIALDTAETAAVLAQEEPEVEQLPMERAGILVLDATTDLQRKVQKLCGQQHPIYRAPTLDKALEYLDRTEVALLVTDITVGQEDTTEFLKLLKQQYPLIMSIVLTETFDAEVAITLINQAKVYRYFSWSTPDVLLQRSLQQGLLFYQKHKTNPTLLQRQQVEAIPEALVRDRSLVQRLAGRFQALRARFRWFEGYGRDSWRDWLVVQYASADTTATRSERMGIPWIAWLLG